MRRDNLRRLVVMLVVMGTLVGGTVLATAEEPAADVATESDARASSGFTDVAAFGTGWVAQRRGKVKFVYYGWGMETKRKKAAGDEWFHASIPFVARLEGDRSYLRYVEFCAKSSNGAVTRPIRMDVWDTNNVRLSTTPVTWTANNNYQCFGVSYPAGTVMPQALGVSVQIHYDNTADKVTFYKAWARGES